MNIKNNYLFRVATSVILTLIFTIIILVDNASAQQIGQLCPNGGVITFGEMRACANAEAAAVSEAFDDLIDCQGQVIDDPDGTQADLDQCADDYATAKEAAENAYHECMVNACD